MKSCQILCKSGLLMMKLVQDWRQDKTRQDKTRQDKTRQDETRQDKTRQDKTRQGQDFTAQLICTHTADCN